MLENVGMFLRQAHVLNREYVRLNELYDNARCCLHHWTKLEEFGEIYNEYMSVLMEVDSKFGYYPCDIEDYDLVSQAFQNVSDAVINRKQFNKIVSPVFKKIRAAIDKLAEERDTCKEEFAIHYAEVCKEMCNEINDPLLASVLSSELVSKFVERLLGLNYPIIERKAEVANKANESKDESADVSEGTDESISVNEDSK